MELSTHRLTLRRGGRRLIRDLSVCLTPGEIGVVLGPNGAGKSSLLLCLAGQLRPQGGEVWLAGRHLDRWPPQQRAKRVAWLGKLPPVDFGMTVEERLGLAIEGRDTSQLASTFEDFDLAGAEGRRLEDLSAGERQRVELAALWLRRSPIWLLDEPTAHLDLRHQARCLDALRRESDRGRSLLVVLHDLTQARALADWVVLIFGDGRVMTGPADEILKPHTLRALYGTPIDSLPFGGRPILIPNYSIAPPRRP